MKIYPSIFIATILAAGSLFICGFGNSQSDADTVKIQVVTTIFPEYDWVMNIVGEETDGVEVTLLLDKGVDLHSYQPTVDDILKISNCDLFIYVGGESDKCVNDSLKEAANKDMVVISLLDVLGDSVKEEEMTDGMQEDEHDHDEDEHGDEHEDGEIEFDEHVWLSLKNASVLVQKISDTIQTIDQDHADAYKANTLSYMEKLDALDTEYQKAADQASFRTLLFGDRFPFRYLVDDYGLDYYAAFAGCSAETEASFETITFLAGKVDELSLPAVMTIEGTDHRIAETIVQNTRSGDQKILTMDSMQSTTRNDVQNGAAYLSVMENNLSVLKDALN